MTSCVCKSDDMRFVDRCPFDDKIFEVFEDTDDRDFPRKRKK